MLKLFKAKSLKKTQETEQGTGVQSTDNKNAKKQRGRSMVEMLGVLAIIGVLSIGGIQGYTLAMRKYRANEILNLVNKYALTIYTSCQNTIMNSVKTSAVDGGASSEDDDEYVFGITDKNFWHCPVMPFTDTGLGEFPKDVTFGIGYGDFYATGNDCATDPYFDMHCKSGVSIVSRDSGDIVVIQARFQDKTLCESVLSMIATVKETEPTEYYPNTATIWTCDNSDHSLLTIPVVMN